MQRLRTITDFDVVGKKVLVRLDLDVPIKDGKIQDESRLEFSIPTIRHLLINNAAIIIIGHVGRPGGKFVSHLSSEPITQPLSEILNKSISHFSIAIGTEVTSAVSDTRAGDIILLENLRFYPGEEKNDPNFAKSLAKLAEFYVNDAFANCHRNHASIAGIPKFLPSAAGIRLTQEISKLSAIMSDPQRPVIFALGGAKSETKLNLIYDFSKLADFVLIGGKLAKEKINNLPGNVIVADLNSDDYDIDNQSAVAFAQKILTAKTVVWNGPMGMFEKRQYAQGTKIISDAIARTGAETIIGGGDTIAAAKSFGITNSVSWVSSGGGAMLEFLAGKELPGLKALE